MLKSKYLQLMFPLPLIMLVVVVFSGCDQTPSAVDNNSENESIKMAAHDSGGAGGAVTVSYDFDDGSPGKWTLNDPAAEITQAKSYSGSYSLGIDRPGGEAARELTAHITPSELDGGVQIDVLSFMYTETKANNGGGGGGIRLLDGDGNLVIGAASGAPRYNYVGADGPQSTGDSPAANTDTWVQIEMAFDWNAGSAEVTFTDLEAKGQPQKTYTVALASDAGVARLDLAHYGTH